MPPPITETQFSVGQIIHHNKFEYRGVIFDVDATFQGTDEWYDQVAKSRPPKEKPWYHVLVDQSANITYVAERHLESDSSEKPIEHPLIDNFFEEFDQGFYKLKKVE